jgi:hypothetical protein
MTAPEAADLLREIADGRRPLAPADPHRPWQRVAVGEVGFRAGDCALVFFSDCASLDHLVSLTPAGGETTAFAHWLVRDGLNPVDLLDEGERGALERRLFEAV